MNIHSTLNVGTMITILLPRCNPPFWFCDSLSFKTDSTIVIVDDDPSTHQAWNAKLFSIPNFKLIHFTICDDITNAKIKELNADFYIFDYELINNHLNGIDIIEHFNLRKKSVLVTASFNDSSIRNQCEKIGIKIIPKLYVPHIPIVTIQSSFPSNTIVLIDDDDSIRTAWSFAAEIANKNIHLFAESNEFIKKINHFDRKTPIYIDSNLSNQIKGESFAKELYDAGFTEIYITTGYSSDKFYYMPWIKSIIGKTPPNFW